MRIVIGSPCDADGENSGQRNVYPRARSGSPRGGGSWPLVSLYCRWFVARLNRLVSCCNSESVCLWSAVHYIGYADHIIWYIQRPILI